MSKKNDQAKLDADGYATPGVDLIRLAFREGWELGYKRGGEEPKGLQVRTLHGFEPHGVQLGDLCRVFSRDIGKNGDILRVGLHKEYPAKPAQANTVSTAGLLQSQLALGAQLELLSRRVARLEQENSAEKLAQELRAKQQPYFSEPHELDRKI